MALDKFQEFRAWLRQVFLYEDTPERTFRGIQWGFLRVQQVVPYLSRVHTNNDGHSRACRAMAWQLMYGVYVIVLNGDAKHSPQVNELLLYFIIIADWEIKQSYIVSAGILF